MSQDNLPRKGIPIKSPHERFVAEKSRHFVADKSRRSGSAHDLLSPLNTLDAKKPFNTTNSALPIAKPSTVLARTLVPTIPLKVDKLPSSFTHGTGTGSFDNLVARYPIGTFCTEAASGENIKNVTVKRGSTSIGPSSDNSECFDIAFAYASDDEKSSVRSSVQSKVNHKGTSTSDQKVIQVSTIQYRHLIIPPCRSPHTFSDFRLIFVQKERCLVLSCKINNSPNSSALSIKYCKVLRIQFIRKECMPSSDWYIDFVLAPDTPVDFQPFKAPPDSALPQAHLETFSNFSTLRVCLDSNCGASVHALDNILLSILNDRRAFYFSDSKDRYGEYETSDRTSSPNRLGKSLSSHNMSPRTTATYSTPIKSIFNSSPRLVPSLESLSTSDSVKVKSRRNNLIQNDQIYTTSSKSQSSPDVFEGRKRQSKRTRTTSSTLPKEADIAYVDPEFELDCVKLFSYPEGDLDSVQVTSHELQRLDPGIWLNDTLIDFELKFLLHQLDKSFQEKVHIFSSFFYRRLSAAKMTPAKTGEGEKTGFDLVRTWTRKVNLFEKDFVVIPINENLHWFLAIICHPSKMLVEENCDNDDEKDPVSDNSDVPFVDLDAENDRARIFIFDSLGLTSRGKSTAVINELRTYLQLEAQDKLGKSSNKSACTGHVIKVPQQENYTDCGCFLLQFVEEFFKKDQVDEIIEINYDLSQWFLPQVAQDRRNVMKDRIRILAADYAARQEMKQGSETPEKPVEEDRSSDIEEIIM